MKAMRQKHMTPKGQPSEIQRVHQSIWTKFALIEMILLTTAAKSRCSWPTISWTITKLVDQNPPAQKPMQNLHWRLDYLSKIELLTEFLQKARKHSPRYTERRSKATDGVQGKDGE